MQWMEQGRLVSEIEKLGAEENKETWMNMHGTWQLFNWCDTLILFVWANSDDLNEGFLGNCEVAWKDLRLDSLVLSGVTKRTKGCGWQVPVDVSMDMWGNKGDLDIFPTQWWLCWQSDDGSEIWTQLEVELGFFGGGNYRKTRETYVVRKWKRYSR
jgi:hypothetical protein